MIPPASANAVLMHAVIWVAEFFKEHGRVPEWARVPSQEELDSYIDRMAEEALS